MILVDKSIMVFVSNGTHEHEGQTAIIDGKAENVTNIGYDLVAGKFAADGKLVESFDLNPGESVFVESVEVIEFDNQTVGRLALKNSRIRMGLTMDAPTYQPGHKTRIYFRLTNISKDVIRLEAEQKYATVIFESLAEEPDNPYSGAFSDEFSFKGLADYKSEYINQIQSLEGKVKDLESLEKNIYSNVLAILAVFVAVFTLLNINISMAKASATVIDFLIFNLSTVGGISALTLLLTGILDRKRHHKALWSIPAVCLIALIAIGFFIWSGAPGGA